VQSTKPKYDGRQGAEQRADAKTSEAIARTLKASWGLRQIQYFVTQTLEGKNSERAEWTLEGTLRHLSFQGLREDCDV
jgi:hypothetical protein